MSIDILSVISFNPSPGYWTDSLDKTEAPPNIRIILVAPSTWESSKFFNPNIWHPRSKGLIQSCTAEFSVLRHCVEQIAAMCSDRERLCREQIETLQRQWTKARFDLSKAVYFAEQPDLHMRIESFFTGVKSLLDLIAQLLSTERIVGTGIHGFHRDGAVYGGLVLKILQRNARKDQKALAQEITAAIIKHKSEWIDHVIRARDNLIHPQKGMSQLMFQLHFAEQDGNVTCTQIDPPMVVATPIDQYAHQIFQYASKFVTNFIGLLQKAHPNS